jgi:hypothetical protein
MSVTLESRLPEIADKAEARAELVVGKTVADIEASAKAHLVAQGSVDTGDLLGSVEGESDGLEGEVSTSVYYGPYVEYGTGRRGQESEFLGKPADIHYSEDWVGMTARPYMTPAAEESRGPFEQAIGQIFG